MVNRSKKKINNDVVWGVVFSILPVIGFFLFGFLPMMFSLYVGFSDYNGLDLNTINFIGFRNYVTILNDSMFWRSTLVTLYGSLSVPLGIIISLFIAKAISSVKVGQGAYMVCAFIPNVCSLVAVTMIWKWMFNYEFGIVNNVIYSIFGSKIQWLESENLVMIVYILMAIWTTLGYNIILLTAALSHVDERLYEAAKLDGAGGFTIFFKITIPMISPTIFYLFTTCIIASLQDFTRYMVMTGKGPNYATFTVVYYLYDHAFDNALTGMGYASAVGWILSIFIGLITIFNFKVVNKMVNYDV